MFWEAEAEVGGVLARANMRIITTITAYPSHQIRSGVERPNDLFRRSVAPPKTPFCSERIVPNRAADHEAKPSRLQLGLGSH